MKLLHVLVVLLFLFLFALGCYMASSMTAAWVIGGIGIALEAVAWIVAFTARESSPTA